MPDTTVQIKSSNGWKFKIALGAIGLVVIVILAALYRFELGLIVSAIGLGYTVKIGLSAWHQYQLTQNEQRRLDAEVAKLEAEADKAKYEAGKAELAMYFHDTNAGTFSLLELFNIHIEPKFYPSATASRGLADTPLLLPASTEVKSYRKLLDVDFIHLLIVGPSGSGKTTVLCHLIDNAPSNTLIFALDPHAQFNVWPSRVNEIVGNGRDYGAIDAKLLELISTLNKRYKGVEPTSQKVLILADEWLSILDKCPSAKDFFSTVGSEARKVNMNLVVSSISMTVDDLAVSGAIRDNLAQLTLSRTWQRENLGELKWSRTEKEMVLLPGPYHPRYQLPAKVESVELPENFSESSNPLWDMPAIEPVESINGFTEIELEVYELKQQGMSLRQIAQKVLGSTGGNQINQIKAILDKFS